MKKIIVLMGKSGSGKTTIYNELLKLAEGTLKGVVPYTTRPKREGEEEGRDYHFVSDEEMDELGKSGKLLVETSYETVQGLWRYGFCIDTEGDENLVVILTPAQLSQIRKSLKKIKIVPYLIKADEEERIAHILKREKDPDYKEICRRFLTDMEDFSEKNLEKCLGKVLYNWLTVVPNDYERPMTNLILRQLW